MIKKMYKRNKHGVVLEYDQLEHKHYPRRATKKYFEESKSRRKMAAKSRKINRNK